jgi:hypothetical protein
MEAAMPLTKEQIQAIEAMPRETAAKLLAMIRAVKARYLASAGAMPLSAIDEMARIVPDGMMQDIVQEMKHGRSAPSGLLAPERQEPPVKGSGWQKPVPLDVPPGTKYVDQLCDVQDAIDRRELKRRLGG